MSGNRNSKEEEAGERTIADQSTPTQNREAYADSSYQRTRTAGTRRSFRAASIENARNSIQEPGIARFEILQQPDDATRFVFVEVYRDSAAAAAHKETAHYAKWRDAVEPMMAEPRQRIDIVECVSRRRGILMIAFEYATAGRIVFGVGTYAKLRAPSSPNMVQGRCASPARAGSESADFVVCRRAHVDMVREAVAQCRNGGFDCVVAFGGGSVIDAAKATAALAANDGDVLDYLEVIGAGKTLPKPGLPCIAVPTTAGTGSEVTRNAVIGSPEHGVKASLRSPYLLPKVAVVDPELTLDLPREITASTGLDALTQLIEAFLSVRANAFTDAFAVMAFREPQRHCRAPGGTATKSKPGQKCRSLLCSEVWHSRMQDSAWCTASPHQSGACFTERPTEPFAPRCCRME